MDPFTQGVLGAALAQAAPAKTKNLLIAGAFGFLGGMAADLDALIRSSTDPLIFLEYHRHFTHSLIFIPVGGVLCAAALYYVLGRRWQLTFLQTLSYCTLGYATHAVLDASTSYGTMLFWPFSEERVSWSIVPIIDPLFTLPLVALCVAAAIRRSHILAGTALLWFTLYLSVGTLQHSAALTAARQIAVMRGHNPVEVQVKPSFANIVVWKTIYESGGRFYVDAVRVGLNPRTFYGSSIAKLDIKRDLPWLNTTSQQARDIQRFAKFSMGYVSLDPKHPNRVVDIRYSLLPNEINPLWSIELSPAASADQHAEYKTHRDDARASARRLWEMISGD